MTYQASGFAHDQITISKLPAWVTSAVAETPENVAFLSGAALGTLDTLLTDEAAAVPSDLLANTLALKAAAANSKIEGRMAREADIRDAYHLTPAGDAMGPDGELLAFWRTAARVRLKRTDWQEGVADAVPDEFSGLVDDWIQQGLETSRRLGVLAGASAALESVLLVDGRAERVACMMADIVLAKSVRWDRPLPLIALNLTKSLCRDLAGRAGEAHLVAQQALMKSIIDAVRLSHRLAERASALRSVAVKLRSKGSEAAVSLFLTEDAILPSTMLAPRVRGSDAEMSPRAARRFCDRLIELGVARELTGRDSFRLYGVGS